jgi:hypothetical protein
MSQRHSAHVEELKKLCALKIINAKPEDSGYYSVVVENQFGSDDSSARLFVNSSSEIKPIHSKVSQLPTVVKPVYEEDQRQVPSPPKIIKHMPPETTVNEGQAIVLNCLIESESIPIVNIEFNSELFYNF